MSKTLTLTDEQHEAIFAEIAELDENNRRFELANPGFAGEVAGGDKSDDLNLDYAEEALHENEREIVYALAELLLQVVRGQAPVVQEDDDLDHDAKVLATLLD